MKRFAPGAAFCALYTAMAVTSTTAAGTVFWGVLAAAVAVVDTACWYVTRRKLRARTAAAAAARNLADATEQLRCAQEKALVLEAETFLLLVYRARGGL